MMIRQRPLRVGGLAIFTGLILAVSPAAVADHDKNRKITTSQAPATQTHATRAGATSQRATQHRATQHRGTQHRGTQQQGTRNQGTHHQSTHHQGTQHQGSQHATPVQRTTHQPDGLYFSYSRTYNSSPYPYYPSAGYPVYVAPPIYGGTYAHGAPTFQALGNPSTYLVPARHQIPDAPAPQPIIIIQQPAASTLRIENPPVPAAPAPSESSNATRETDRGAGQVYVLVDPPAAEVYLDDDYLGTGETLGEVMALTAGVHVLEVEHPDYPVERLVFSVSAADEILVEVDLEGDRRGRKSRIRTADEVEARLRLLGR